MPVDTLDLKQRVEVLRSARAPVEAAWNDVEKFILQINPGDPKYKTAATAGWMQPEVWDHTATDGAHKLAANLHGAITPSGVEWMQFGVQSPTAGENHAINKALDQIRSRVFTALQESDFDSEAAKTFLELVSRGTPFLILEPVNPDRWEGLDFTAVLGRECTFEVDPRGELCFWTRDLSWTAKQIKTRFEKHTRALPDRIVEAVKDPNKAATTMHVVFAVYERAEIASKMRLERDERAKRRRDKAAGKQAEGTDLTTSPVLAPELRPYGCAYFLAETGEQLGDEGGYYEMPVFHALWEPMPGTDWGRGPGVTVLPTVKYLNALLEMKAQALAKGLNPTSLVTERGLLSEIDHSPGSHIVVRDVEKSIKAYESGAKIDWAQVEATELRAMIRAYFFVDELKLKESPQMTATEAQIRYELMNRLFGPTLGRIQSTLLTPMLKVAIAHLARAGQLPALPAELESADPVIEIKYLGPLAAARNSDRVAKIERVGAMAAAGIKMGFEEAARDTFNFEAALRRTAELQGCPTDILRSPEDVQKLRAERAQLQRRMAQAEAVRAEGEAVQQAATAASAVGEVTPVPASPVPVISPTMPGVA